MVDIGRTATHEALAQQLTPYQAEMARLKPDVEAFGRKLALNLMDLGGQVRTRPLLRRTVEYDSDGTNEDSVQILRITSMTDAKWAADCELTVGDTTAQVGNRSNGRIREYPIGEVMPVIEYFDALAGQHALDAGQTAVPAAD